MQKVIERLTATNHNGNHPVSGTARPAADRRVGKTDAGRRQQRRKALDASLGESEKTSTEAILDILRVGTSAGGARPKAVIAMR